MDGAAARESDREGLVVGDSVGDDVRALLAGQNGQRLTVYWGPEFREEDETGLRYASGPGGTRVYYWLDEDASVPISLTFRDAAGNIIVALRSDDDTLPVARRPGARRGLNRFVWDLRFAGPVRIDAALAPPRNKPLANEPDPPSGPTVVPG